MKHIRLILGIIGVVTASIAAVAQQQPAPPAAPQVVTPPPGAPAQAAIDSPLLRSYSTVTKARLLKPEDRNWLMIRRTYDGWGLQPTRQDQRLKRVATEAGVERANAGAWLAPGTTAHQQRRDVRQHPNNQVAAYDAEDRHATLALQARAAGHRLRRATHRTAASPSTATRSTTAPAKPSSSRSMRRPVRKCGPSRCTTTACATT
jgi:hypothetical protein